MKSQAEIQKELSKLKIKRQNPKLKSNQKRSLTMRIKNLEKQVNLENLFTIDEVLDDIETEVQEIKEKESRDLIDNSNIQDEEVVAGMELFREIYIGHPELSDTFLHFSMKLRYFLTAENIVTDTVPYKKIQKFLKLYPNLDIVEVANQLGMPYE